MILLFPQLLFENLHIIRQFFLYFLLSFFHFPELLPEFFNPFTFLSFGRWTSGVGEGGSVVAGNIVGGVGLFGAGGMGRKFAGGLGGTIVNRYFGI